MNPEILEPKTPTYSERYEKAQKLLDTILDRAAKQHKEAPLRRAAKIGSMKPIIYQWAARNAGCMETLEFLATH